MTDEMREELTGLAGLFTPEQLAFASGEPRARVREALRNYRTDWVLGAAKLELALKQLHWMSGLCNECYDQRDKTCVTCHARLSFARLRTLSVHCDQCNDTEVVPSPAWPVLPYCPSWILLL